MARTHTANAYETETTSSIGGSDTTLDVVSVDGIPPTPFYVALRPRDDANREYVKVESVSGTTFDLETPDNRHLDGSAADSGQEHPVGTPVKMVVASQLFEDIWDEVESIDVEGDIADHEDKSDPHGQYLLEDEAFTEPDADAKYVSQVGGTIRGYVEPGDTPGDSGTVDLDLSAHNIFEIDPSGDIDITFSGLPSSGEHASATIIVKNDSHAITWPSGTEHPGGDAPTLDGKTYLGVVVEADGTVVVGAAWQAVA